MRRFLFASLLLPSLALADTVAVVKSDTLEPYARAVAAFAAVSRDELIEYDLKNDESRAKKAFAHLKENKPALVWALGAMAATTARRELPDVPLLFTLVPDHERLDLTGSRVWGIGLSTSARSSLESLVRFMPSVRRLGVVYDPRHSGVYVQEARRVAVELGLEFQAVAAGSAAQAASGLEPLTGLIDALWMVPDRTTSSVEVFQPLLAFSRDAGVPIIAVTDAQVAAGAMLSYEPELTAMARQAGRLANQIVHERKAAGNARVVEPEGLQVSLNLSVAKSIPPGRNLALEIFTHAARQKYPVVVHE